MPSLQIRELPDDLYQRLALRAKRSHRSLAQQALTDLSRALCQGSANERLALLAQIAMESAETPTTPAITPPEVLIREDRER